MSPVRIWHSKRASANCASSASVRPIAYLAPVSVRLSPVLAVVAVGGVLGSLARAAIGALALMIWPGEGAIATLIVNVIGALAIGMVGSRASASSASWWIRPFVITGVLGGFTTFSAYALETAGLLDTDPLVAAGYLVGTVVVGVVGVRVGMRIAGVDA